MATILRKPVITPTNHCYVSMVRTLSHNRIWFSDGNW